MKQLFAFLLFISPAFALYNGQQGQEAQAMRKFTVAIDAPLGLCSGVLIAPKLILTAGHCLANAGKFRIFYLDELNRPQTLGVNRVALHPQFQEKNSFTPHDIGLIELKTNAPTSLSPLKIAKWYNFHSHEKPLTLAGFGSSEKPNVKDGQLRTAQMLSTSPHIAGETFAGLKSQDEAKKVGMCVGDSGGPVLAGNYLVGILKGGTPELNAQCTSNPVYTPVKLYMDWIEKIATRWGVEFGN